MNNGNKNLLYFFLYLNLLANKYNIPKIAEP